MGNAARAMGSVGHGDGIGYGLSGCHRRERRAAHIGRSLGSSVGPDLDRQRLHADARRPILLGGSLGDRFGRKRVFLAGVVWFALASLLCGLSPNVGTLIAARALQGVGGALLTPGSLALLQSSFRAEDRARAIGAWSGLAGIAGAAGPSSAAAWCGRIVAVDLPDQPAAGRGRGRHGRPARAGVARSHSASKQSTSPVQCWAPSGWGLTRGSSPAGRRHGPLVVASLVGGVAALGAFASASGPQREPMLPLGIFASRLFSAANPVTFAVYAALSASSSGWCCACRSSSGSTPFPPASPRCP